ncbi:MAG: hypothetical protein AUG91_05425 [Actinobacteria bacterium 13_1_20CM_4_69_9]|nr:MAG: hypothetical protein AUG91_05425 [Actinobacteria bacterium 13_1_20CM_4_69_9]
MAITADARLASARSTNRNAPARNGSSLCFVDTSRRAPSAPYTSACTRCVWTMSASRTAARTRRASTGSTSCGADRRSYGTVSAS